MQGDRSERDKPHFCHLLSAGLMDVRKTCRVSASSSEKETLQMLRII
jgi:hypothetical protein